MVKLYTSSNCPWCKQAKEYLKIMEVEYEERNITNNDAARKQLLDLKVAGVPTMVIGEEVIVGFDMERTREALLSAGLLREVV